MMTTVISLDRQHLEIGAETTLLSLLHEWQVYPGRATVELNGLAIKKSDYIKILVFPGDTVTLTIEAIDRA